MKNGTADCRLLKPTLKCRLNCSLETGKIADASSDAKFASGCPSTLVARNGREFGKGWEGADKSQ